MIKAEQRPGVLIFVYNKTVTHLTFLLVKQRNGYWSFPSGGSDENETPLEAAKRELAEETGIIAHTLQETSLLNEFNYTPTAKGIQNIFLLLLKDKEEVHPQKGFTDEIKETRWVNRDEAALFLTRDGMMDLFKKIEEVA